MNAFLAGALTRVMRAAVSIPAIHPVASVSVLRVEFLLKTESGYLRDAVVT